MAIHASEYRAARRNRMRGTVWAGIKPTKRLTAVSHGGTIAFWRMTEKQRAAFMRGGNHPRRSSGDKIVRGLASIAAGKKGWW